MPNELNASPSPLKTPAWAEDLGLVAVAADRMEMTIISDCADADWAIWFEEMLPRGWSFGWQAKSDTMSVVYVYRIQKAVA